MPYTGYTKGGGALDVLTKLRGNVLFCFVTRAALACRTKCRTSAGLLALNNGAPGHSRTLLVRQRTGHRGRRSCRPSTHIHHYWPVAGRR